MGRQRKRRGPEYVPLVVALWEVEEKTKGRGYMGVARFIQSLFASYGYPLELSFDEMGTAEAELNELKKETFAKLNAAINGSRQRGNPRDHEKEIPLVLAWMTKGLSWLGIRYRHSPGSSQPITLWYRDGGATQRESPTVRQRMMLALFCDLVGRLNGGQWPSIGVCLHCRRVYWRKVRDSSKESTDHCSSPTCETRALRDARG